MDADKVGSLLHLLELIRYLLPAILVVSAGSLICVGVALGRRRG